MSILEQQLGPSQLVGFVLVLARLGPLFVLAPLFSSRMVPGRVRGIVAVGLALGLSPLALRGAEVPVEPVAIFELVLKEILVGLALAFAVGVLFAALATAGSLLDTLIGFAYGALVDPLTGNQGTVIQQLYGLIGVTVFIAIGGDTLLVQGLARSYELVGLLEQPALDALLQGARAAFSTLFTSALQICAPVVLAIALTDAAFGLISKVVPQLNVFAVGAPAKVLVGLLLIGASLPFVTELLADQFQGTLVDALSSLGVAP